MEACQWVDWVGKCYFTGKDRGDSGCMCGLVIVGERVSGKGQLIVSSQREPWYLCGQTSMERCTLGNENPFSMVHFF